MSPSSSALKPSYPVGQHTSESASTRAVIDTLSLIEHPEGGYFAEIDRDPLTIPNPFLKNGGKQEDGVEEKEEEKKTAEKPMSGDNSLRNASTSIFYLLTPVRPQGHFHRNLGRTVHTLISGRGVYVLIHADEPGAKKRVESFVVGKDVAKGERAVWIVEGGKYKASYLLPMDGDGGGNGKGDAEEGGDKLLISEVSAFWRRWGKRVG
jgi:predicted cupin superfamily sugar epimerase